MNETHRCFWCNSTVSEASARHEGHHSTWCPHFRRCFTVSIYSGPTVDVPWRINSETGEVLTWVKLPAPQKESA